PPEIAREAPTGWRDSQSRFRGSSVHASRRVQGVAPDRSWRKLRRDPFERGRLRGPGSSLGAGQLAASGAVADARPALAESATSHYRRVVVCELTFVAGCAVAELDCRLPGRDQWLSVFPATIVFAVPNLAAVSRQRDCPAVVRHRGGAVDAEGARRHARALEEEPATRFRRCKASAEQPAA